MLYKIIPTDESYEECFLEAIKCHHNDIAEYIKDNWLDKDVINLEKVQRIPTRIILNSLQYHNFKFVEGLPADYIIYFACKYDCLSFVDNLKDSNIETINKEINEATPLSLAAEENYTDMINLIFQIFPKIIIGKKTFKNCKFLISIDIPSYASLTGYSTFEECTNLQTVFLPDSVTSINDRDFYGCSSLVKVYLPKTLKKIGNSSFYGCKSLESIEIPESVTSLGNYSFENCSSLKELYLPNVVSIGVDAFYGCTNLRKIILPRAFDNIYDISLEYLKSYTGIGSNVFLKY